MKNHTAKRRGFTLVELLVVIAIIAILAGVGMPALMSKLKDGYRTEAVMNAKQIGLAMFSFEQDYGSYPDDDTKADITANDANANIRAGTTSNAYFSQLVAAGLIDQESPFYCKAAFSKKPNNNTQGTDLLDKGEVGFAYIMNGTDGLNNAGNSAMALACAALKKAATDDTFDYEVYNKKAVVLRVDNSISTFNVNKDGKCMIGDGKTLLQTGTGTVWESASITPQMVAPEQ